MQFFRSSKYIGLIVVLLGMANRAPAAIIAPPAPDFKIMMQVGTGSAYPIIPDSVTPIADGDKWKYQIDGTYSQHGYEMTMSFTIEPDPSVFGNVSLRNTTASTQDYIFTFTLPVSPIPAPSQLNGSMAIAGTADATAGAISSTSPDAVYSALIDGATVKTIAPHPFSLGIAALGSSVFTDGFGLPTPIAGPAVATDIGIKLHFNVTPGDLAGITSQFTASPVPEPTALLGLAIGGLVLSRRRK